MFSTDLTLNDFVCPIPICPQEADLETVLKKFQHVDCDLLAILRANNTWGTISSQSLLSLVAKFWQQEFINRVGHPTKQVQQISISPIPSLGIQDFKCLIESVIVYQADTKLQEFLNYIEKNSLHSTKNNYLIINASGELQGRLDREKLLQYLALRSSQPQKNIPGLPVLSDSLLNVIDSLAIPIKIETTQGEEFYLNKCWRLILANHQDVEQQEFDKPDVSIANWWMKLQLTKQQQQFSQKIDLQASTVKLSNAAKYQCLSSSFYPRYQFEVLSSETNLNLQSEQLSSLQENEPLNQANNIPVAIQIEQKTDWNYLKIPLTLAREKLRGANKSVYWLILATKASLEESQDLHMQNASSATPETIKDKLLATISHELKSPLTGIVGLSSLLKAQKLGKLNQRQTRYVQLIYRSGQQMMSIVNDLLELTSLTAGKLELKPERIDLESFCQQLHQQILIKLKPADTAELDFVAQAAPLEINIEPGLEIAIADKTSLSSILSHLILEIIGFNRPLNTVTPLDMGLSPTTVSSFLPGETLAIRIISLRGWTAIIVGNQIEDNFCILPEVVKLSSPQELDSFQSSLKQDASLNLIIAKYLAEILQGDVLDLSSANNCQLALLLPKTNSELATLAANPSQETENIAKAKNNITILCLYPEPEVINPVSVNSSGLDFNLKNWAEQEWSNANQQQSDYRHRIIEADGLEQAHTLARIWQLDVIVLDGHQIAAPSEYLRSLQKSEYLSALPLITLDTRTTEAANQIEGLNVYPCLLPVECRSVRDLMQVIQIATSL